MNLQESIRRILREESRFDKMGEKRYKSCSMSDITRMEIIDNFLKKVETNSKYNKEEPNYDMLLDDWDGYDDQVYIQNQLDEGRIIFYEGWVDSCWSAVYKKPQYEGMDEEEVIDSIITKRFPRIAEEFNMVIDDYGYFNNGDGYIMYIVLKESNTNLQENIQRILREEISKSKFFHRRIDLDEVKKLLPINSRQVFYETESFAQFKYELTLRAVESIMYSEYELGWEDLPEQEEIAFVTEVSDMFEDIIIDLYKINRGKL